MKQFWKSKTVWGIAISALPTILQLFGVPVPSGVGELLNQILVATGSGLAVYGRVKAVDKLTLKKG